MEHGTASEDLEALAAKAEAAFANGDWATAAAAFEELVRTNPEHGELKSKLARAYEELERPEDVIELLSRGTLEGVPQARRRLAAAYMKMKDYPAAMPLIEGLILETPDDPTLRKWQGRCQTKVANRKIAEQMKRGKAFASANQLEEAEQVYLDLLNEYPSAADAHRRLAQLYMLQRRWDEAIPPLLAALALEPDDVEITTSLARALFKRGELTEAITLLDSLADRNKNRDALFLLQRCHLELRDWLRVEEVSAQLLAVMSVDDPLFDQVSNIRQDAQVEIEAADIDESADVGRAKDAYRRIADRHSDSALAWLKLGLALEDAEEYGDAAVALRRALRLRPTDSDIRWPLTRVVIRTSEEHEILGYVREAIAAGTADLNCYRWLARHHAALNEWPSALESAEKSLTIDSNGVSDRLLKARALMHLARYPEALDELDYLISIGAKLPLALQLKADIFVRLARPDDAIDLYHDALAAAPKHPLISHRLSSALLLKGDIEGFHRFHERRREIKSFVLNNKEYPFGDWNGELSIDGKLLVWSEFGFGVGQNILHMAFLKPLAALGLEVVFEVEARLVDICRRSFPQITVVAEDAQLPEGINHHTPIGSLSRWLKPDLASFAVMPPYLLPNPEAVRTHRDRLQRIAGEEQLLIGVSWASNNPLAGDIKSIGVRQFIERISLPGVALVNLQYGEHSEAIAEAEATTGKRLIESGVDNSNDLDGLSAVVAAMDLVVCIGHTTAHIAGAVGTPSFVLLPAAPFAHWLAEGERCIWYPETTLFRQAPIDDGWDVVLTQVADAVRHFAQDYGAEHWLSGTILQGPLPLPAESGAMSSGEIRDAIRAFIVQGPFAPSAYQSALELITRLRPDDLSREVQLQRAELLTRFGEWQEARAAYVSLASDDGGDPEIARQILSISLEMYDLEYALSIARRLSNEEAAHRLTIANILYRLRRDEEAVAELRAASLEAPQIEALSTLFGTVMLEKQEFERAEAYLANQAAIDHRTEDYTLLGRSISAQGRHEEALAVYDKALALRPNDPAANFWRTHTRIELGAVQLIPLPPLLGNTPNVSPEDVVIFCVADNSYFWDHALILLGSLGRHSPGAKCHVHVINPDPAVAQAVEMIGSSLPDLTLSYSYEHADLEGCSAAYVRTYYASVRFVRLAELVAKSPASYVCLDADCIVRGDVAAAVSSLDIEDVAIRMRFDERPHMTVAAGALILRPTAAAAKFINRVSSLIAPTLEAREAVWFLDQVVLSHVQREHGDADVSFRQLDMTHIDWFFRESSLVWTGKGPRKSEDRRYTDEVSRYRYLQEDEDIAALRPEKFEAADVARNDDDTDGEDAYDRPSRRSA